VKRIAILQSNYIPWKGYFDIINSVDEFVIYDDAQYTKRDWRNRNVIKTKNGLLWLTIPVKVKDRFYQKIREVKIADKKWATKHWETIKHSYGSAPCFENYEEIFEQAFQQCKELDFLSDINRLFINVINSILGIHTLILESVNYNPEGNRCEKIISICSKTKAEVYLSGPSAKNYINEKLFAEAGVFLEWVKYDGYPEYNQLNPPFEHSVSIIDLIFSQGANTPYFMKSF
jgi:hypothetical protein